MSGEAVASGTGGQAGSTTFRDATDAAAQPARLRLDQLLAELVDRAGEVMATQGRLRGLLDAVIHIAGETSVRAVLQRVTSAACTLVEARYAALGVLSPGRDRLIDFIVFGLSDQERESIGELPQGKGLLGLLITDPKPLRLDDIAADPRSVGFPANHPAMTSFLGAPIVVRQEVFGNLYLTEKAGGFTDEDEQLVVALAAAAGIAIQNALLFEDQQRRERWAEATTDVTAAALAGISEQMLLELVASASLRASSADQSSLLTVSGVEEFRVSSSVGIGAKIVGLAVPAKGTLAGEVLASGKQLCADMTEGMLGLPGDDEFAQVALAPLMGQGEQSDLTGVLVLSFRQQHHWRSDDLEPMAAYARQAAVALQLNRAQRERDRLAVLEDRDRIARDLHDLVIQRLFATGMTLQSALPLVDHPKAADRISTATDDLDVTIKDLRQAIFSLHSERPEGMRAAVAKVVEDVTGNNADLSVQLRITGTLDAIPSGTVADHLLAVVRESLSNVVHHADATKVDVDIDVTDHLSLIVTDNGCGILPEQSRRSGLLNMSTRAHELFGSLELVTPEHGRGTRLVWTVPIA